MEELITVISNQGFAIAMCTYVIVSVNKSLQEMTKAITILSQQLDDDNK